MIIANTWTLRVLCSEFETPALKRRAQAFAHGLVQIDQCLDKWLNDRLLGQWLERELSGKKRGRVSESPGHSGSWSRPPDREIRNPAR